MEPRDPTQTIRPDSLPPFRDKARLPNARIGGLDRPDFVVDRVIGRGGMGVVENASQTALEREVALKRLVKPDDPQGFRALLREARIASRLQHPGIVPVHAVVHDASLGPVVVMKRLEGRTWKERIAETSAMADSKAHARIAIGVCYALEYAHDRGVLHQDVKPDNVIVGEFGEIWLVDWGIAYDTRHDPPRTSTLGTPAYMAPEMVDPSQSNLDARSDVYLVGACLFEALYGVPPHKGDDPATSMASALGEIEFPSPTDGEPSELVRVCKKALRLDPARRFGSVELLRTALEDAIEHEDAERLVAAARRDLRALPDEAALADLRAIEVQLESALTLWPESPQGRVVYSQLQRRKLRVCLDAGDLHTAQRIASSIDDTPPALQARLETLARTRQDEVVALQQVTRDFQARDLSRDAFWRMSSMGILLAFYVLFAIYSAIYEPGLAPMSADKLFLYGAAPTALWVGGITLFRKRLFTNWANRSATITISTLFVGGVLHRAGCWYLDVDPVRILQEELLMAAALLATQWSVHRVFIVLAAMYLGAYGWSLLAPELVRFIFLGSILMSTMALFESWRSFDEL